MGTPTLQPTNRSSPDAVMLAIVRVAVAGDHLAFIDLLAFDTPYNLLKVGEIVSHCAGQSPLGVPFDVEYRRNDLAVGQFGSVAGRYAVFMELLDGEWYISEIQGTAQVCPF